MQNIDLMNLAGFCRNCLSPLVPRSGRGAGRALADPEAREIVYGMPYKQWQAAHQQRGDAGAEGRLRESHRTAEKAIDPAGGGAMPAGLAGGDQAHGSRFDGGDGRARGRQSRRIAADRLRSLIDRIERLEEERSALGSDIKDIFAEAKSAGFDVKVIRQLIRIRKQEPADVEEQETLLDVYRRALGM